MYSKQRGNILFLILLAVFLFAALSYAVTSNFQGGGNSAKSESAQAQAADLMNYFIQMSTAAQRMMVTGGVKDYELNFYYLNNHRYIWSLYDNTFCTVSNCRVFDPAGGGVSGRTFPSYIRDASQSDRGRIFYASIPGAGSDLPDIVYVLYGVKPDICEAINKANGLGSALYNVNILETSALQYHFTNPVGPIPASTQTFSSIPSNAGQLGTFCGCNSSTFATCTGHSWYPAVFHVLVAR